MAIGVIRKIWYQHEGQEPELIKPNPTSDKEMKRLTQEYILSFECGPGQHRYGKDKVWNEVKEFHEKDIFDPFILIEIDDENIIN